MKPRVTPRKCSLKTIDKEQLNVVIDGVEQTSTASRSVVSALCI